MLLSSDDDTNDGDNAGDNAGDGHGSVKQPFASVLQPNLMLAIEGRGRTGQTT